jgi:hypothetical protein
MFRQQLQLMRAIGMEQAGNLPAFCARIKHSYYGGDS